MYLLKLLSEDAICTDLQAKNRDDAIKELLTKLAEAGKIKKRLVAPAQRAIIQREALGSTAIGKGVAVPHARAPEVDRVGMAIGLSSEGLDFRALDGEAVHAIFLVVGPEEAADEYIAVLSRISRLVQNDDFRRFLLRARTGREVLELIQEMDA
jgi:mannitol/fructose-specific phosphotransferase system IIA component (Ntr-type)